MESTVVHQPSSDEQRPLLPAPVRRIVLIGTLALLAGFGLARMGERAPSQPYPGMLMARVVPVTADRAGIVEEWLTAEGEPVRIDQPLVAIADGSIETRREQLDADVVRLQAELERALAEAELELDWRIKEINDTIFTARLQSADFLEEQHAHDMEKVALTEVLESETTAFWTQPDTVIDSLVLNKSRAPESRLSTMLRLEAATNSSEVCSAQVELCDEQIESLEDLKDVLPARVRTSVGVDVAEQSLEQAQAERTALEEADARIVTVSPAIGRAGVHCKRVGEYAEVGDRLVDVLDDSQRFILIEVPSHRVAQFTIGRELTVLFSGDQKRSGRVARVAPQAVVRDVDSPAATVVTVHIEQAGRVWPDVPVGTRVDVSL